jgi:hypothetical protein
VPEGNDLGGEGGPRGSEGNKGGGEKEPDHLSLRVRYRAEVHPRGLRPDHWNPKPTKGMRFAVTRGRHFGEAQALQLLWCTPELRRPQLLPPQRHATLAPDTLSAQPERPRGLGAHGPSCPDMVTPCPPHAPVVRQNALP